MITSVDRLVNGLPLNPPVSLFIGSSVTNPSRLMVVFVAITPAIPLPVTISTISSNCSIVRSGAIFNKITAVVYQAHSYWFYGKFM